MKIFSIIARNHVQAQYIINKILQIPLTNIISIHDEYYPDIDTINEGKTLRIWYSVYDSYSERLDNEIKLDEKCQIEYDM